MNNKYGLYKDEQNRTIYINRLHNKAFIISPNDMKKFNTYGNRYFIPVLVYVCLDLLKLPNYINLILSIISFILILLFFHLSYLPKLSSTNKFTIKENLNKSHILSKEIEPNKLLIKALLFLIIGLLLPVNAYRANYNLNLTIISYLGSLYVILYAYKHLQAYKIAINK